MIKVEFVGGARKMFASRAIEINRDEMSVDDLFVFLQDIRLDGSPLLEPKNTLVAINGADTSATGGLSSVVRDGDTVSIIPVIHGGSGYAKRVRMDIGKKHFDLVCISPPRPASPHTLDDLRSRHPGLRIQAVSARFILGRSHARKILHMSAESERRGIMLANRIESDILMRFALTMQISKAIKTVGIRPSSRDDYVLISMGPVRNLDLLYLQLKPCLASLFASDNSSYLEKKFKVTKKTRGATSSISPLEDILVERAAVLGADV